MDHSRRRHRTTDPKLLALHLHTVFQEIADYSWKVGDTEDLSKIRNTLSALYHQCHMAATQITEHQGVAEDAMEYREVPEWDVVEGLTEKGQSKTDASPNV